MNILSYEKILRLFTSIYSILAFAIIGFNGCWEFKNHLKNDISFISRVK